MAHNDIQKAPDTEPVVRNPHSDIGGLLVLINGVFAATVGAYVATRSVLITLAAGVMASLLATLIILKR